jgi:toxin-antitoxin system PIN domain toxin
MSPEFALVDANVLVYSRYHDSEHHTASHALLERAQDENAGLCVAAQCLTEFYSVVTNPRRVSPPREPNEVLETIEALLRLPGLTLVPTPADLPARWIRLTRRVPVRGADIFDVQLVATMLANDVTRIYTYNRPDFERFGEVKVLTP